MALQKKLIDETKTGEKSLCFGVFEVVLVQYDLVEN